MYDAWALYSGTAKPYLFGDADAPCTLPASPPDGDMGGAQEEAIGHAAWRLIRHRFRRSPGSHRTLRNADSLMSAFGHDPGDSGSAAAVGRCIGEHYIARGLTDGANEAKDYGIAQYEPVNSPLNPWRPGNRDLSDPDRWQPLSFRQFVDQAVNLMNGPAF